MFAVEVKADTATAGLERLSRNMSDMSPAFADIGEFMVESTKQNFIRGESPDGVKWAPKSQTTLARYGARKSNRVDIRPLFGPSGVLHQFIIHEAGADQVEWGSPMIYAAVHQFGARKGQFGSMANGASIPWGNIPAREFLGISAADETGIMGIIEEFLTPNATP